MYFYGVSFCHRQYILLIMMWILPCVCAGMRCSWTSSPRSNSSLWRSRCSTCRPSSTSPPPTPTATADTSTRSSTLLQSSPRNSSTLWSECNILSSSSSPTHLQNLPGNRSHELMLPDGVKTIQLCKGRVCSIKKDFPPQTSVWKHLVYATGHCMPGFPRYLTVTLYCIRMFCLTHCTDPEAEQWFICPCVCVCVGGWMTVSSVTSHPVWSVTGPTLTPTPKRWPSVWCSRRAANSTSASYGRPSWEPAGRSRSPWVTIRSRQSSLIQWCGLMIKDLGQVVSSNMD